MRLAAQVLIAIRPLQGYPCIKDRVWVPRHPRGWARPSGLGGNLGRQPVIGVHWDRGALSWEDMSGAPFPRPCTPWLSCSIDPPLLTLPHTTFLGFRVYKGFVLLMTRLWFRPGRSRWLDWPGIPGMCGSRKSDFAAWGSLALKVLLLALARDSFDV